MPNLKDIADLANVSISTVSRVLSGNDSAVPISEATRERILELVEQLHYYPNAAAKALSSRRAGAIGLLIPAGQPDRGFMRFYGMKLREFMAGIESVAEEAHLNLILQVAGASFLAEHGPERMLAGRLVDALIFYDISHPLDELPPGSALVFLGTQSGNEGDSYVVADDNGGVRQAVEYLYSLGHRRIGFIAGLADHFASNQRLQGYQQGMNMLALSTAVYQGDGSMECGKLGIQQLVHDSEITAVLAANDYMASGAIEGALAMGIAVPTNLSVIGAEGLEIGVYSRPKITTLVTNLYSMSRRAGFNAIRLLEETTVRPIQEVVPVELELRESCAPITGR